MKTFIFATAALALVNLSTCQEKQMRLENSAWLVEEIGGTKMQAPVPTLEFRPDGRVGGKASCNNYGGSYKLADGRIGFSGLFATKMACPPPMMAQEQALLASLQGERPYTLNGDTLTLTAADGRKLVARRVMVKG